MLELLLLGLLVPLQALALVAVFVAEARLNALGTGIEDAQRVAEDEIRSAAATVKAALTASEVMDAGVSSIKTAHHSISDIPFNILDNIPATRAGSKAVRGVHNAIAGGIYDALSAVNRGVGERLQKKAGAAATLPPASSGKPPAPATAPPAPGKPRTDRR